jgi:hypothetical protein
MAEATPAAPKPQADVPKQLCQKCRREYPLDQFDHGIEDQACICKRCLTVMGYQVQA